MGYKCFLPYLEIPDDRDINKQVKTVREWIENPKGKDLFTRIQTVEGLSYPVIVCFQEHIPERFERNVFMRAKAILIVVYIESKSFDYLCFGGACARCHGCAKEVCIKCHKTYYCSQECIVSHWKVHKPECKRG